MVKLIYTRSRNCLPFALPPGVILGFMVGFMLFTFLIFCFLFCFVLFCFASCCGLIHFEKNRFNPRDDKNCQGTNYQLLTNGQVMESFMTRQYIHSFMTRKQIRASQM